MKPTFSKVLTTKHKQDDVEEVEHRRPRRVSLNSSSHNWVIWGAVGALALMVLLGVLAYRGFLGGPSARRQGTYPWLRGVHRFDVPSSGRMRTQTTLYSYMKDPHIKNTGMGAVGLTARARAAGGGPRHTHWPGAPKPAGRS